MKTKCFQVKRLKNGAAHHSIPGSNTLGNIAFKNDIQHLFSAWFHGHVKRCAAWFRVFACAGSCRIACHLRGTGVVGEVCIPDLRYYGIIAAVLSGVMDICCRVEYMFAGVYLPRYVEVESRNNGSSADWK